MGLRPPQGMHADVLREILQPEGDKATAESVEEPLEQPQPSEQTTVN